MADIQIAGDGIFPDGTTVGAYPRNRWPVEGVSGAPTGSAVSSGTVATGTVSFSGLADATSYIAYASSPDRYKRFSTPPAAGSIFAPQTYVGDRTGPAVRVAGRGLSAVRDDFFKPVMASPPTLTLGAANAASTIAGSTYRNHNTLTRYLGANPVDQGGSFAPNNITGALKGVQPWAWEELIYADKFEMVLKGQGGSYRLFVDGAPVTAGYTAGPPADGANYNLLVDFTSVGGRAVRKIRMEMTWTQFFAGFRMHPTCNLAGPPTLPKSPRVIFLGDSYTEPQNATAYQGYAQICAKLLGWDDAWASGLGGTGISQPGSSVKFQGRVQNDVIAYNPDVVIIQDQDNATAAATQQADLQALLTTIKTALPNVRIVGMGGVSVQNSQLSGYQTVNTALRATYESNGAIFVDPSTANPWIFGTGRAGTVTNDGNADFLVASDQAHPTTAGHDYIGRKLAAALAPFFPLQ